MKPRVLLGLLGGLLLLSLAACESTGGRFRFEPVVREFPVPADRAFASARDHLVEEGFRIRLADLKSGRIEALTPVRAEAGFRESSQRRVRVRVSELGPDESRVAAIFSLLEESETPVQGLATHETPVRAGSYYEEFFDKISDRLKISP